MAGQTECVNQIFISYRRDDSAAIAGRIYDRMAQEFGREAVFKDVDSIPLGVNFRKHLDAIISECTVVLAVIGDRWVERLEDPRDFVRAEIEAALRRDIPVIPLLVQNASLPPEESLPESLRELSDRNGMTIGHDPHFHTDTSRLISSLKIILARATSGVDSPGKTAWVEEGADDAPPSAARAHEVAKVAARPPATAEPAPPAPTRPAVSQVELPLSHRVVHSHRLVQTLAVTIGVIVFACTFTIFAALALAIIDNITRTDSMRIKASFFVLVAEMLMPYALGAACYVLGRNYPRITAWEGGLWVSGLPCAVQVITLMTLATNSPPYPIEGVVSFSATFFATLLMPLFSSLGWHWGSLHSHREM